MQLLFLQTEYLGTETLLLSLLILVLLLVSAIMSGSEVAYFSLKPTELEDLERRDPKSYQVVRNLLDKPRFLLSTILIANNLVNIGIITVSFLLISKLFLFEDAVLGSLRIPGTTFNFLLTVVLVPALIVLFGENVPKVYAANNNVGVARVFGRPLLALRYLLYYFSWPMVRSGVYLERKFTRSSNEVNYEDLNEAIDIAADADASQKDLKILKGVIHFGNIHVKQIMKPRIDITALDITTGFDELQQLVRETGYSRIPVYEETLDQVKGVLYVKDLLGQMDQGADFKWQQLIREAIFTPETKKIDDLLSEIQEKRTHLVIVVDEYGGTSGLVTLEDIIEEVVGEIKDEFDDLIETFYRKIDDRNYIFEGKVQINDVLKILDVSNETFDEVKGESDSLAGLILEISGNIPEKEDVIEYDKFKFRVLSVKNHRIERVKLTVDEVD